MGRILITAVNMFSQVIVLFLFGRAMFSWFARNPYSASGRIYRFLIDITEPIVAPCRNLLAKFNFNTGMLDFSVFIAFFAVEIARKLIITLLLIIF